MSSPSHIGMLAGEASGDLLGAGLIRLLRETCPELTCSGIGGPAMQSEGFLSRHPMERLSVMGIIDPLKRLPELLRIRKNIREYFLRERPAAFVGIDSPDFNLGLEISLREAGIPVIHYVSPSVWAWRQNRIKTIARAADLVLTLFPFEVDFYRKHQVPAQFIGHPLADAIPLKTDSAHARKMLGLPAGAPCLAILPGSRQSELMQMAPVFIEAARQVAREYRELCIISASANAARHIELTRLCQEYAPDLRVRIVEGNARTVMSAADVVLVTSGTATLEALLCGRPMVIAYRMSQLIFPWIRYLVKVPFIGLPNLLADEKIVPEFVQQDVTADNLAKEILGFLKNPERSDELRSRFHKIHQNLRCNADKQAASAVIEQIHKERT